MKTLAFIFARGGSKGLPRKNIKLLAGKPLIQYSIDLAGRTPGIGSIFVSTDDEEIATIAGDLGARIIPRPTHLATDTCSEWLAWRHAVEYVVDNYGVFDLFVSLPTTSPLRTVSDVTAAIALMSSNKADVCIAVTPSNRNPYFNMVKKNQEGYVELVNKHENTLTRRQDAPAVFDITTAVYVTRPEFIMEKAHLFAGRVVSIEIPKIRAVDIDDEYDFLWAEMLLNIQGSVDAPK